MERKFRIEKIIEDQFLPYFFLINDVSEDHRGHLNFKENVESHFEITVVSKKFNNTNKVERHRMINRSLKEEFLSDLHALTIKAYTIEEFKNF